MSDNWQIDYIYTHLAKQRKWKCDAIICGNGFYGLASKKRTVKPSHLVSCF
jgi:hypothetical protein